MAIALLFLTPIQYVIAFTIEIVTVIVATRPLRAGHGFWAQLLIVVVLVAIVYELIAYFVAKLFKTRLVSIFLVGEPRFDELKGPGARQLRLILGCIATLSYEFKSDDERVMQAIGQRSYLVTEKMYRWRFLKHGWNEDDWPKVWQQIGDVGEFGVTYRESLVSGRWELFTIKQNVMLRLALPLAAIYTAGSAWLLARVVQGGSPLRLIQFTLLAGFVIAALIFANFTTSLRSMRIFGDDVHLPGAEEAVKSLRAEGFDILAAVQDVDSHHPRLVELVRPSIGRELYPDMEVRPGYVDRVRGLFSRYFILQGVVSAGLLMLCLGAQWPLALAFSSWPDDRVNGWTIKMLVGVPLVPLGLMASLTLGFYVISHLKRLRSLLVTAILLALIPLLITYTLKGSLDEAALLSSVVTAIIGALADAVAQLVKEKPGARPSASSPSR